MQYPSLGCRLRWRCDPADIPPVSLRRIYPPGAPLHQKTRYRAIRDFATATGLAILLSPLTGTVAAPSAVASPSSSADAQTVAAAIAVEVSRLETEAEILTERYNGTQEQLTGTVSKYLVASRQLAEADTARTVVTALASDRVRSLYMSGGRLGFYADVLRSNDISDALRRTTDIQSIIRNDHQQVLAGTRAEAAARTLASQLARLTINRERLQRQAEAAAQQVRQLLDSRREMLSAANARVRHFIAVERHRTELAAAAQAHTQLASLGLPTQDQPFGTAAAAPAIAAARTALGLPYLWGGTGPQAYDCSGLVQWAFGRAGVRLPRVAADQYAAAPAIALTDLAPGDLVFWGHSKDPRSIYHVGIYVGGGQVLHAPRTGDVVKIAPLWTTNFFGANRPGGTATVDPLR
jgi:peptidoglycan DL-endopeptidase CwlO